MTVEYRNPISRTICERCGKVLTEFDVHPKYYCDKHLVARAEKEAAGEQVDKDNSASDYVYTETVSQPYQNCKFSAGFVEGHPIDTLYLKLERNGVTDVLVVLRPDEMAAIAYCASGTLWSHLESLVEVER